MPTPSPARSILFVCLGNICRSPAAHEAFLAHLKKSGRDHEFTVDSCGMGDWHVGHPADARMRNTAQSHGVTMTHLARTFHPSDLEKFDLILPMDFKNRKDILEKTGGRKVHARIRMFRDFDPEAKGEMEVPDPYYGEARDFEEVWVMVDRTAKALLETL